MAIEIYKKFKNGFDGRQAHESSTARIFHDHILVKEPEKFSCYSMASRSALLLV